MVKKRKTAAERLAELENDPEYVRQRDEWDAKVESQLDEMRRAEKPLVDALRSAGISVHSVWDLANTRAQYPDALPILFEHLQRPYPDLVLRGIAWALAVPASKKWWKALLQMFQANPETTINGVKTALAGMLAAAADDDVMGDVIALVLDPKHGEHRIMLLQTLRDSARPEAHAALQGATGDPELAKEAKIQLRELSRRSK